MEFVVSSSITFTAGMVLPIFLLFSSGLARFQCLLRHPRSPRQYLSVLCGLRWCGLRRWRGLLLWMSLLPIKVATQSGQAVSTECQELIPLLDFACPVCFACLSLRPMHVV